MYAITLIDNGIPIHQITVNNVSKARKLCTALLSVSQKINVNRYKKSKIDESFNLISWLNPKNK